MDESVAVWEAASPDCIEDEPAEIADISAVATPLRPYGAGFNIDPRALVGAGSFDMRAMVAALAQSLIRAALDSSGEVLADAARMLGLQLTPLIATLRTYSSEESSTGTECFNTWSTRWSA